MWSDCSFTVPFFLAILILGFFKDPSNFQEHIIGSTFSLRPPSSTTSRHDNPGLPTQVIEALQPILFDRRDQPFLAWSTWNFQSLSSPLPDPTSISIPPGITVLHKRIPMHQHLSGPILRSCPIGHDILTIDRDPDLERFGEPSPHKENDWQMKLSRIDGVDLGGRAGEGGWKTRNVGLGNEYDSSG
ncbi:hypothetical protein DOTSEDRAFT_36495 [Dothistroma septosporum NZE10]|uniref:Uncharacterized protein n=1 Tax=Dothistroma septosporum (strain NZE10 / CBS 128990) TaxID=675120 RepID=N1PJC1_DOTSN|nr:hypothetical protein DOTSEDRAFT_36495 [Dothistroma septosporum NZE10]